MPATDQPPATRDNVTRYVEDRLAAVLDVEDFEKETLGQLTGDFAVAVSGIPDAWMTLASGRSCPTVSFMVGVRPDEHFEARLEYALVDLAATLREAEGGTSFRGRMSCR